MKPNPSVDPVPLAGQWMAMDVISELLASTAVGRLPQRLTEQLCEFTGARTVLLLTHPENAGLHEALYVCPPRRVSLFSASELAYFCPKQTPGELFCLSAELPVGHPLRAPLLQAKVESLLRFPLYAAGELVGALLLLDLPELERADEVTKTLTPLLPTMAMALKNAMGHQQIEKQAEQLKMQACELEHRVAERTAALEAANGTLAASRVAALNMMEDAVAARQQAEQSAAVLQLEVAERRRAEEAVRESEARLSMALEVSDAGIWQWDLKSDVVCFDARFHALLGYAPGELPSSLQEWMSYHHPDDMPVWISKAKDYLQGDSPMYESEHRIRNKAGTWEWVLTRGKLVNLSHDDSPEHFVGIAINITERKQTEVAIRRAHERLRCFVDANVVGVILCAPSGGVLEANDYYLHMIGYTREEFDAGLVDWRAITPPEWLAADEHAIEELRERGVCTPYEKECIRRDGTRVSVYLSDTMLPGPEEQIAAFVLDITERKRAEEALQRAHDELEQRVLDRTAQLAAKNEELKGFAYTVSHDLKAPLRGIAGYSDELNRKHRAGLSERAQFCVNQILTATHNLDSLIEDLLHYSRLDTETPSATEVNLSRTVEAILKDRSLIIAEQCVEVTVDIPLVTLRTWERGLVQVLGNLVDNALKYSRKATPPRIGIRAEELDHGWRLAVSDNGIGFDMKYHDRIFGLFNRLVRGEDFEGTGAGLAIVKKVLDKQDGRIWAESAPGQGATFFVEFPKPVS